MSKYTHTMALATINECHSRECYKGHWIAAGITGQLHNDFVSMGYHPPVTIPSASDILPAIERHIQRIQKLYPGVGSVSTYIQLWVREATGAWGVRPGFAQIAPLPKDAVWVGAYVSSFTDAETVCKYLVGELRYETGITDVPDDHPFLRDLRADGQAPQGIALRASLLAAEHV